MIVVARGKKKTARRIPLELMGVPGIVELRNQKLHALEPPMLGHVLLPLYMDDRHEVLDILNRDP